MINNIAFDVLNRFGVDVLVETGVWQQHTLNFTKGWKPLLSKPFEYYGIELDKFWAEKARTDNANDHLTNIICNDSRAGLYDLLKSGKLQGKNICFYLDAHWNDDWPLLGELQIIISNVPKTIVMIDDFETPGKGFGFDAYRGIHCGARYIKTTIHPHTSYVYYSNLANSDGRGFGFFFLGYDPDEVEKNLSGVGCFKQNLSEV